MSRVATGNDINDIEEYDARHLLAPFGIKHYFWKRRPSGLVDTEGGLYLRSHDLAKIAYPFLKNLERRLSGESAHSLSLFLNSR